MKDKLLTAPFAALMALAALTANLVLAPAARADITGDGVKIGVLTDMSGPFADSTGKGSVEAARMAVEDFGGKVRGKPVTVVVADHQNKPDIAAAAARRWFDEDGVDVVTDLVGSSVALAVNEVARRANKATLVTSSGSPALVGASCSPNSVLWTFNTRAQAGALTKALVDQGAKKWFFITVDYAFGHALEADTTALVQKFGGQVMGRVRHPLNTTDFSALLLRAQASGADVIALANTGADTVNATKQAQEFGIGRQGKQRLATLILHSNEIHSLGQENVEGLLKGSAFEWSLGKERTDWSRRFYKRVGLMPSQNHAGTYSAVLSYLKAAEAANADTGTAVIDQMKRMPVNDMFARDGHVRADGLHVHEMYLVRIKPKAQAKEEWDYYDLLATIPGIEAYGAPETSECPAVAGQKRS
ncbi:ABC transporter substrate-binding protein [Xenophilus azovorans]|uniref:ABC transporter substrate-binding protein n=1 Tax=Xenophilus azovorans TaxID=151755 RepID=UPI000A051EBD|nr:ABC transporter substrate-binding protein [Xenophilus azovorans]